MPAFLARKPTRGRRRPPTRERRAAGIRVFLVLLLAAGAVAQTPGKAIQLPPPRLKGPLSLEEALSRRRSVRKFDPAPLTWAEVGQLLWAAQGATDAAGHRTAPSAGATYPLEIRVATREGVFRYAPGRHEVFREAASDARRDLKSAASGQEALDAPAIFVVSAVPARTAARYGGRAPRYVQLEAGHAAQNLLLEAVALDLAAVPVGAFDDARVRAAAGMKEGELPLYLIPVGRPQLR